MDYGIDYYEAMLRAYSESAPDISRRRWEWLAELKPRRVLDYGSGVGWFRAFRPPGVEVDSFDVGPAPQTGIKTVVYDVVCFWDVLEHVPDFSELDPILRLARAVAGTVPVYNEGRDLVGWKHFKPGEHLHYFTEKTLQALLRKYGFRLLRISREWECPPREDIVNFLFVEEEKHGRIIYQPD